MDKVLFGDNQFFAVNHLSDERSRAQSMRFKDAASIMRVLDEAIDIGIGTFMCTTHERIGELTAIMRANPARYGGFRIHPCMPYAHKYANAVTELGIVGAMKEYMPGNIFSLAAKGGLALARNDFAKMMEILIDAEMKMFEDIQTPVIFLQNVVVDLLLGLGMEAAFADYDAYIRRKYGAEPGYITMNMPLLVDRLEAQGITNPIVCFSMNKLGFRVSPDLETNLDYLTNRSVRAIAMQVLAAGALRPREAIEFIGSCPNIESVLFGASSKDHILETKNMIEECLT